MKLSSALPPTPMVRSTQVAASQSAHQPAAHRGDVGMRTPPLAPAAPLPAPAHRDAVPRIDDAIALDDTDPRMRAWVDAHNARFDAAILGANRPLVEALKTRAAELVPTNPPPRTDVAGASFQVIGGSLVRTAAGETAAKAVVDVRALPSGSAVLEYSVSPDGSKVAYGFAANGADWQQWQVRDVATGKDLLEQPITLRTFGLQGARFSADSKSIVYPVHDQCDLRKPTAVMLHRLGTSRANDVEIYRAGTRESLPLILQHDGADGFVISQALGVAETPNTNRHVRQSGDTWTRVDVTKPGDKARMLGVVRGEAYFRTDALPGQASATRAMFGITGVDLTTGAARVVVPARPDVAITSTTLAGDKLVVQCLDEQQRSFIEVCALDGALLERTHMPALGLPERGTLSPATGEPASTTSELTFSSVTAPPETLRIDLATGSVTKLARAAIDFDGSKVTSQYLTFRASDGAQVPVHLFHAGTQPPKQCIYFYYGNIGIVNGPQWNRIFQLALELGIGVALVGARGGGERGGAWRDAGTLDRRRTERDIVEGGHFVRKHWRLGRDAIEATGRSWGGFWSMVMAVYHGSTFGAVQPTVPGYDMVRYHERHGWFAYDFGATMSADGGMTNDRKWLDILGSRYDLAAQLRRGPVKHLPRLLVATQLHDERVPNMVERLAFSTVINTQVPTEAFMVTKNGGHSARAELVERMAWSARNFGITALKPLRTSS